MAKIQVSMCRVDGPAFYEAQASSAVWRSMQQPQLRMLVVFKSWYISLIRVAILFNVVRACHLVYMKGEDCYARFHSRDFDGILKYLPTLCINTQPFIRSL